MREKREAAAKAEAESKAADEKRVADAKKAKPTPQPKPISMSSEPDQAIETKPVKPRAPRQPREPKAEPQIDMKAELTRIAGEIKADVIQAMKAEIEGMKKADSGRNVNLDVESIKAELIKAIKANNPEFDLESVKGDIIKAIQANKGEPGSELIMIDAKTGEKGITTNGLRYFVENFIKPRCRESGQAAKELLTRAHKGKILTLILDVDSLTDK